MPAMSNKTPRLLLWGTQSEDDPVVSGPRHWATKRHMTTPGHIQSISKRDQKLNASKEHVFPSLFRFLNDSFLQHFWVAPDRTQRTYITALWWHHRAVAMATWDLACCYAALIVYFQVLRSISFHVDYMMFFQSLITYLFRYCNMK